ncbi:MAG: hypothetical protein O7J95_04150 [Planctomycetota bacterium]|nr:hypothetical protein [Planctomycetota bacterium]
MRSIPVVFACLLSLPHTSCRQPPELVSGPGFAAVLPGDSVGLDLKLFEHESVVGVEEDTPLVVLETRFLKVEPGLASKVLGGEGLPFRKVNAEELNRVLPRDTERADFRELGSPKLTSFSGQLSHTVLITQAAYIQDYVMEASGSGESAAGPELTPRIGVLNTGIVVQVRPVVRGEEIEIRQLDARLVEKLGTRVCEARVAGRNGPSDLIWQEPVLLTARPDPGFPDSVRLAKNETLVVPLRYQVRQASANARAYATPSTIRETYYPSSDTWTGERSALEFECLVLLDARPTTSEERQAMLDRRKEP